MKAESVGRTKKNENLNLAQSFGTYVRENLVKILSFIVTFIAVVLLSFVRIASTNTISSYNIADYEVGQISDITVVANKSLPADSMNPVAVEKGEKVIKKGFAITEEGYAKLKRMSESRAYIDYRAFANSILFLMLLSTLYFFLFSRVVLQKKCEGKELITEHVFFILNYAMAVIAMKTSLFSSPYTIVVVLPGIFCSFLMAILFGQIDAICFSVLVSLGILHVSGYQMVPFVFMLSVTLAASRIVRRIERRIDLVFASMLQGMLSLVFLVVLKIVFNDSMKDSIFAFVGVVFNGFISGILCLGFLTPLEYILNTASVFRLMDLSDLNNPTMKKMLVTAGGTYNHSMMVASLSESACREIGANSLIARVGGYYHDIGKMENPEYFTENQTDGENIHKQINPSLSVSVIRSHVKRGEEKGRELRLPPQIIKIISEHHGNQVIKYFYSEAKKLDPDVKPEDYSYTGVPPTTKESGVVALADTVEAACRSLDNPSVSRLEKFIHTLFQDKIENHQLDNCGLTFKDIDIIENTFVQMLASYYHSRVKYPDQKDPDTGKTVEDTEVKKTEETPAQTVEEKKDDK